MTRLQYSDGKRLPFREGAKRSVHRAHSVFEDASCGVASHHLCASVAPACSCDPVTEPQGRRVECACGHTHVRPAAALNRESDILNETVPPGVL